MNRTEGLFLDAGVWIAARDPEDRFNVPARSLLLATDRSVAVLDLTFYEVANVVGARKGQVAEARYLLRFMERRCGETMVVADADLLESAIELAAEYNLTAYAAAYVAAARRLGWTLVSCDMADLVSKGLAVAPDTADYP